MKKLIIFILAILIIISSNMLVFAEEYVPDEYEDILDAIPKDISDMLPDGLFSKDITHISEAVKELSSWEYLLSTIFDILNMNFSKTIKTLIVICALLIVSSLINNINGTFNNPAMENILHLISSGAIIIAIMDITQEPMQNSLLLFERIKFFVNTLSPTLTAMYAMGGNLASAVVNNFSMIVFLSLIENIFIVSLELIIGICFALTFASAFLLKSNFSSLNNTIKKGFSSFIGIIMVIFSAVLSSQSLIASKSDTLTSKTAKALATQLIPLVGGTVGESLKLAGASIEYLRANIGIALIIVILLMTLPTIIGILIYRAGFGICSSFADMLGCDREGKLISEISSIYGYVLAIISISAIVLLLLITIFAKCSSPIL